MRRTLAVPAAVLISLALLVLPAAAQETATPGAQDAASPSASPASEPGSASTPTSEASTPLPTTGGPLDPGAYVDASLGPQVAFSLNEGWQLVSPPSPGIGFELAYGGDGRQIVAVTTFDGDVLTEPCFVPEQDLEGDVAEMAAVSWLAQTEHHASVDATAQGFWDHLAANPHLAISEPESMDAGGLSGLQAEVTASVAEECAPQDTFLWRIGSGAWYLSDGDRARYTLLDLDGRALVIAAETWSDSTGDHDAFLEEVDRLIRSMRIST